MEDTRSKRTAETNREKQKRKNDQEKKTKSETTAFSTGSSVTDPSLDSIVVVGKGCNYGRSKRQESGYRLHECFSEAAINLVPGSSKNLMDIVRVEGLHPVASNSSFLSAKSDFSDIVQKRIHELEDALHNKNLVIHFLKKQLGQKELVGFSSVSTETDISLGDFEEFKLMLKELEKKISSKEKKIKELNQRIEDSAKARDMQNRENKRLSHQVNLLNRQLKSMFELLATKNWNSSVDPADLAKYKNKVVELEASVDSKEKENTELVRKIETLSVCLESKENELLAKSRELVEYKNESTLEMCKLITQIDSLQKEAKSQSQVLESKITEAQNSMDEEIVNITQKLEDRYQKDMKSAIEKFQGDFERLAELPKTTIEKLLQFCEPEKIDVMAFQKEWDKQRAMLEAKIESMQADRIKEMTQLKDSYESKVMFLKTQVEALSSQLKERKEIIDIFETELMEYKSNSSMNLLKASSLGDDISSLKELYTAEIFSQKQVHKLQVDIFEEKVKTLTEEILYHAKNEEIHMQELGNAKKMAFAFREKYEQLVCEWEERVEKEVKTVPKEAELTSELDNMISELKSLIESLRNSEEAHEERIRTLEAEKDDERLSLLQDIGNFKTKLSELQNFQATQAKLDETIHSLIRTVGINYTKTVEALLLSQVTELSLKQLEMCASEKRHIEEIDALKNDHEKELEDLRSRVKFLEESKPLTKNEMEKSTSDEVLEAFKRETEDLSTQCMKMEGMMAIKEVTEEALNRRIRELEDIIKAKEENCQKKLEDLTANCLKVQVLSSAKDDLVRELEDKLSDSEKLLEKSCEEVDRLTAACSLIRESPEPKKTIGNDGGDFRGFGDKFERAKSNGERLKMKLIEVVERVDFLEGLNAINEDRTESSVKEEETLKKSLSLAAEKSAALEEEKIKILDENDKMKEQMKKLVEKMAITEKVLAEMGSPKKELSELKVKLKELESEKDEILSREKLAKDEKRELLDKNRLLEENIRDLNERMDLMMDLSGNNGTGEGVFSISVNEVHVVYEEEREVEVEQSASMSTVACQVVFPGDEIHKSLRQRNEELKKENEILRSEIREGEDKSKAAFHEEMISKFKNIQKELSEVIKERDRLVTFSDNLKEEVENLRIENCAMKMFTENGVGLENPGVAEMNRKVEKLSEYIRTLTAKLDAMKASNELLISESHEHFRRNQNLVDELEEAWSQRYEIEDQLAKMRKENALLNLHRKQLEETNRRISSLLTEGKPSIVSWIKIHETVESIVDEVLSLKTSFSDSGSGCSTPLDVTRTSSELKMMTDTLHAQLKNKTMLCDELIIQKEILERELKNLETLLRESGERCLDPEVSGVPRSNSRKRHLDLQSRQPGNCSLEKRLALDRAMGYENPESGPESSSAGSHLSTLNILKRNLLDQVELEKAQFRETLQLEIRELTKEMPKIEGSQCDRRGPSGNGEECLKAIEAQYEKEVMELMKEFQAEMEKLREAFVPEKEGEDFGDNYAAKIDTLKSYFGRKWADLEKRYMETCYAQKQKRLNTGWTSEAEHILEQFKGILCEKDGEEERKLKMESFLKEMISRHEGEVRSLRENYEEAVALMEGRHVSEVQRLQSVVLELKENILAALGRGEDGGRGTQPEEVGKQQDLILNIRAECEAKLKEEKKWLCDSLEEARQKHKREILALEEFWTEKLSECETKCALMKATQKTKGKNQGECDESFTEAENRAAGSERDQSHSERSEAGERQNVKCNSDNQGFGAKDYISDLRIEGEQSQGGVCVYCLSNQSIFGKMEVKTDDDKLGVMLRRDTLEEMVASMRSIITRLLTFIGQHRGEASNTSFDDTLYKSIRLDLDRTISDSSVTSNCVPVNMDLSLVFQEIKENSLLNSSDQVRFELDRCLQQLQTDATCLLALSFPVENSGQSLSDLIRKVSKEKDELEAKVLKVEEVQEMMKKEINMTKDRLSQWERNLEVVSEGYGEEIVEPKQIISLSDLKEKLKLFLTEHCSQSTLDVNLLDEICKEGDLLQEEWKKEKCDLQQQERSTDAKHGGQIDAADKQVHSLKKFLEEQAIEREQEREAFDRELSELQENLKAKERDNSLQNRTNREAGRLSVMSMADDSVDALEGQVKDLTARLREIEENKGAVEGEFQNAVKKIWSLREVIQDLEVQLAEVSERENNLKKKLERSEAAIEELSRVNKNFKEELEAYKNQDELKYSEKLKTLEEELINLRHVADQVNPDSMMQLKANLRQIEAVLIKKTKDLEQLHVSSTNVSCSSPSEDVSIRDYLDATRCSTPDEMCGNVQAFHVALPTEEVDHIHEKLARHTRAEEVAMKYIRDLKMQLRNHRKTLEEVQTERDVLLEKIDMYLKENSSLKVRLEEQRCNAGLLQKQLNANLESQINRLEVDVEKLNELCNEKDKQLRDLKEILENTTKSLKMREAEAMNKSKEENTLITTLKTDLANALNENGKLEEKLEKTMEKLRKTLKMPALIDSMLDEKNAEIDRLEKEVARLSSERTSTGTPRSNNTDEKLRKRIRFSEPESFSGNISSISVQCPSEMRNYSDTSADFRNSSFRIRRPIGYSTKLESNSSIAPLQLSPRGADLSFNWKLNSPVFHKDWPMKSSSKPSPTKQDLHQMEEMSKLQAEVESKQREISELHLEIDILKRQLVEMNQEMALAKSQTKEIQNELITRDEEIRKLKNNEKSLLFSLESVRANHTEEVEELQNKLRFEHGKVEKVYEEIKALEVKKIEIEESFLSLREDYNEKINSERKTAEALLERIRTLEAKNEDSEIKLAAFEKEIEAKSKEMGKTIQTLTKEIVHLRSENEKIRSASGNKINAETQVEGDACMCLILETPKTGGNMTSFRENFDELKTEFDKMAAVIGERDFNKKEAFSYAMAVKRLFSVVLARVNELSKELDSHVKKVMECSVDDLAIKVQKELVLSAKLDNRLLSSIEANGFASKEETPQPDCPEVTEKLYKEVGGGDNQFIVPKALENDAMTKVVGLCEDLRKRTTGLEKEKRNLEGKVSEQQKVIRLLEESLKQERERVLEEKERCCEDAKIMELLRVNLEKGLQDIRTKEKELRKEKQHKMLLEKEMENYKKYGLKGWEGKKVIELNAQLESQKEKLVSIGKLLEEEKKMNRELRLSLEEVKIERMSEKSAQRLLETDLALLREQKQNIKAELIKARKLLHARNEEVGRLKRKINLQEIDIKALTCTAFRQQVPSDLSSAADGESLVDLCATPESPTSLLSKIKELNSCVERQLVDSSEVGGALFYMSQERNLIKKLEDEGNDTNPSEDTLVPDTDVDRKLWALEKGRLVMDLETLKRENEALKHDLMETCKSNDSLKQEISKMKKEAREARSPKENASNQIDHLFHQERVSHLTRKYMRTESHRKALAWQKNYLMITLKEYQRSEEALRKMGRKKTEARRKARKSGKFRVVALAVLAIFRMRFIVKRWKRNTINNALPLLDQQMYKLMVSPFTSIFDIYNDPVDPLSYQTQNICHQSSSHVLTTPPSRDPGPQSFSFRTKDLPESLDRYQYLQENVDLVKALPCIFECLNEL